MNVRNDTAASNGGFDEKIKLLISSDSQLEMSGSDSSDFEVLGSVSGQLQHLSSKVLEDGGGVDGRCGSNSVAG